MQGNPLTQPFCILTVDVQGDLYTFSPELAGHTDKDWSSFAIGSATNDDFDTIKSSSTFAFLLSKIQEGVRLCKSECDYFGLCGGGDPGNKLIENGSIASTETLFCRLTKKTIADFVIDTIL
jgi:uncharacterized protein